MMDILRREPVRAWLYGVTLPILAILVARGIISQDESALWAALVAAAVAIPTEVARSRVEPVDGAGRHRV